MYNNNFDSSSMDALMSGGILIFFMFIGIISLVMFLMISYSYYKMAKKEGIDNAWLAFVPVANLYIMGKIAKDNCSTKDPEVKLCAGYGIMLVLMIIPIIGQILSFVLSIYLMIVAFKVQYAIFDKYSEKATLYLILLIIFPIVIPFILLSLSNKQPRKGGNSFGGYNDYGQWQQAGQQNWNNQGQNWNNNQNQNQDWSSHGQGQDW